MSDLSEKTKKHMDKFMEESHKKFGDESLHLLGKSGAYRGNAISTGCLALDVALGVGGIPRGRIVEIYGPESCIAFDSFLPYEVWEGDKRKNHKGGTIQRLFERFHNVKNQEIKQGVHLQHNENSTFYIKSVNEEDFIVRNEILDVVYTGKNEVFKIELENGYRLLATKEHKIFTPDGYLRVDELDSLSLVFVHNNTRVKGKKYYENRPEIFVKYHPKLPTKKVNGCLYYRGQLSRMTYEAIMNNFHNVMEYKQFLDTASKEEIEVLWFIPDGIHVHHKDENFHNNNFENLMLINPSEHGKLHSKDRLRNFSFIVVPIKIKSITSYGEVDTYDLKCAFPYNNYIANGIVVHNSGKTTLCQHIIAEAQMLGGFCAFIDFENALDPEYASNCGVNVDNLFISQPNSGEQGLGIVEKAVENNAAIVVVDSVAALVPRAEIEGDFGDSHMGLQARLMGQALRKLVGLAAKSNTTIIFTNQLRQKIGVIFGNPETTTGGMALRFWASLRLDIRRIQAIKDKDEVIGNRTKVTVKKNKVAAPFRVAEFDIMYNEGISKVGDILDLAVQQEIVEKKGAFYSYGETRLAQGKENAKRFLNENRDMLTAIENALRVNLRLPLRMENE